MKRTTWQGGIVVYSYFKGRYALWKWNGRKYHLLNFVTWYPGNDYPEVDFRVSNKDLSDLEEAE